LVPTDEGLVIAMPGDHLHWASRGSVTTARCLNRMLVRPNNDQPTNKDGGYQRYALIVATQPHIAAL
jgi:hypothetical protein